MFFKKISNNENKYFELNSKNKILKTSDLYEENPSFIKINKIGYLNFSQLNDSKINTIVYPTIQSEITGTYIQTNSLQINDSIIFKDQLNLNNFTLNYQGYFSSISLSSVNDLLSINDCYAISPNPITINTVTINNFTSNIDKSQAGIGFTVYKNVSHLGLYYVHADNTYSNEFYWYVPKSDDESVNGMVYYITVATIPETYKTSFYYVFDKRYCNSNKKWLLGSWKSFWNTYYPGINIEPVENTESEYANYLKYKIIFDDGRGQNPKEHFDFSAYPQGFSIDKELDYIQNCTLPIHYNVTLVGDNSISTFYYYVDNSSTSIQFGSETNALLKGTIRTVTLSAATIKLVAYKGSSANWTIGTTTSSISATTNKITILGETITSPLWFPGTTYLTLDNDLVINLTKND